jgi:hypothetical protein
MSTATTNHMAGTVLLVPMFAMLAACGGGSDQTIATQAPQASRPSNYAVEVNSLTAENEAQSSSTTSVSNATTQEAPAPAYLATTVSSGETWTRCAVERATCSFSGTKTVRYGANGTYVTKSLPGPVACTNTTFGDPVPGVAKSCDYLTTITTPPTTSRDKLKWPFASNSIWNMPIGSGAVYVPANLSGNPGGNIWAGMPGIDDEKITLRPTAPMTAINASNAAWTGRNRCSATGGLLVSVPMPSNYVVPNNTENSSAAFLMPDGRTIIQTQPLARCTSGGPATSLVKFAGVDLYGAGITGAHGGSGLSAIGGSIRVGELRPGQTGPRHALKVNVYAKEALYRCSTRAACYRWPAVTSDSYAVGFYGTATNNGNSAMKMGALLAIPASRDLSTLGLETAPAKQLAWTLQNYGAYIVDDTYAPGFALNVEDGPDGSMRTQFKADWGFELAQKVQGNTAWVRDMQKLAKALQVVNNNSASSIGGGGTPRQPLAPAIAP